MKLSDQSLDFFLECPSSNFKSRAVLRSLFLTKLFVLFADTKHFSLFLLSLTNDSLFVLQGRWWKKSVLATSSVVIILFLLSPVPDCKAVHWLFLVTEALPPWLCLQHSICLSLLCPLMSTLLLAYLYSVAITSAEWWRQAEPHLHCGALCSPLMTVNRASGSAAHCDVLKPYLWAAGLFTSDGFCHLQLQRLLQHFKSKSEPSDPDLQSVSKSKMFRKAWVWLCHLRFWRCLFTVGLWGD